MKVKYKGKEYGESDIQELIEDINDKNFYTYDITYVSFGGDNELLENVSLKDIVDYVGEIEFAEVKGE